MTKTRRYQLPRPDRPDSMFRAPDRDVLETLLLGAGAVEPLPERFAAVKTRVLDRVRGATRSLANTLTIYPDGGEWAQVAPGVHRKNLHKDDYGRSFLLRLEPGAILPTHEHDADEECMVLEGEVHLGELHLRAGDYHLAQPGSQHSGVVSPNGALLFIRSQFSHRSGAGP